MVKLDIRAFGLASGILWGSGLLIMGLVSTFSNYGSQWINMLSSVYIGYKSTVTGSIIGGLWGFIDAGIGGLLLAWIYNKLAR